MSELLNLPQPGSSAPRAPSGTSIHPTLLKADFHGYIMTGDCLFAFLSKNTAIVGIAGIVIHETEGTFQVVTKTNKLKILPKQHSIFTFAVPVHSMHDASVPLPIPEPAPWEPVFRAADRAGKKFKGDVQTETQPDMEGAQRARVVDSGSDNEIGRLLMSI
ncbi:hypothetical protein B0H14DRAFT_3719701 [Mycena olivaceomarginata]|nr:hypothetical protein B0H14DRAFT_3719701 [Mycena olivaceomarginata]